jgi:hypothetical protein
VRCFVKMDQTQDLAHFLYVSRCRLLPLPLHVIANLPSSTPTPSLPSPFPSSLCLRACAHRQLSEKELDQEHTRLMSAKDPVAPQNIIRFNFKEKQYKLDATVDQCSCHFEMEGNLLHRDTEDGKRIVAEQVSVDVLLWSKFKM